MNMSVRVKCRWSGGPNLYRFFASFTDRMLGAVQVRLFVLFDVEHAPMWDRTGNNNKKTITTSESRVYLEV